MNPSNEPIRELSDAETDAVGGQRPGDPPPQYPEWPEDLFGWKGEY
ncbi:hypothetical protein [Pantoea sp. Cy-639]|jgi:hypothetical protein|nr:hypothetical protein [Pantoea sp. Cy-639]